MNSAEIQEKWASRLEEWRRLGIRVDGAAIAGEVLADLEAIANDRADEALTLEEAAAESGYSVDHLRKLVAMKGGKPGKIPNAGKQHAPRIRRADLPRKPGTPTGYDPAADAFSLEARRRAVGR